MLLTGLTGSDALFLAFAELADRLGAQTVQRSRRSAYVAARTAERLALGPVVLTSAFRAALIQRLAASAAGHATFGREPLESDALDGVALVASALTGAAGLAEIASAVVACRAHWDGGGRPSLAGAAIPLAAQLVLAGDLADAAIGLTQGDHGSFDLPLAADLLASTAGTELAPEVASAAASILTDPALRSEILDPISAVRAIAMRLVPLAARSDLDILRRLVVCTETRNPYYQRHSTSTARIALAIGRKLGLDPPILTRVELCALAHDVGELVLTEEIFASSSRFATPPPNVREHPQASANFCKAVPLLAPVAEPVLLHHEHLDGLGYPRGLRGEAIPIEARIVGVADAIDALRSERAFRDALSDDQLASQLTARRGSVFDSTVVDAALASIDFHA